MEAHIGEHGDEVEQDPEADGIGRQELRVLQVPQHLPHRGTEPLRTHEAGFLGQQQCHDDRAGQRQAGERQEAPAPADEIVQQRRE